MIFTTGGQSAIADPAAERAQAQKLMNEGNFKEAYDKFRNLCLEPTIAGQQAAADLRQAVQCLYNLGRVDEVDELLESTIKTHSEKWRLLETAASLYLEAPHQGFMIAGKYERGGRRGGGQIANSIERDRIRSMQLLTQAMPLAQKDDDKPAVSQFFLRLSEQLLANRGIYDAWRLGHLSNIAELPDYDEGYPYNRDYNGAPVDAEGKPLFHAIPKSWEEAKTDGERWRWAQMQAIENHPASRTQVLMNQANFFEQLYGVSSMQIGGWGFQLPSDESDDTKKNESGTYALHTLKDEETIAKLATGIKRFALPDEFNPIKLLKIVAEEKNAQGEQALTQLAQSYSNRRQYATSAKYWQENIDRFGPGGNNWKVEQKNQIVGNWGQFDGTSTQPAGKGAEIGFRFRNGKMVKFDARAIDVAKLLDDVKAYLKSDPGNRIDWNKMNIANFGYQLVNDNDTKYLGEVTANWELAVEPRENHFDKRITVTTPLQKAGAYLVTATMADGNVSKIILWVADTAIVQKQLDGKSMYFVGDAVSGSPLAGTNVEFFGWQQRHLGNNRYQVVTTNFAEVTGDDGLVTPDPKDLKQEFQWLITARGKEGSRMAYLGFQGVWRGQYYDAEYNQVKVFTITDRPVYRPGQPVHFKFWVARAQYDQKDASEFAKASFPVEIYNPKGERIYAETLTADDYGGLEGKLELPIDATLGSYSIQLNATKDGAHVASGGNSFRVEEYKKPEFEVKIEAPTEPVMLGEKITAKIEAKYYFGAPVAKGTVKYKIYRSSYSEAWYPIAPWDWCYGNGYWWFAYDYSWYRGFDKWGGCARPLPPWMFGGNQQPPELVAEVEQDLAADGKLEVEIDTMLAKELHGNFDHEYSITAEVRDESRRTIVGTGKVLVARKPFKVFSWLDRGYYRVGEVIEANFRAQTLDKKPVQGKGVLTLLKITYDKDGEPVETPVRRWDDLPTGEEGTAIQQIKASAAGQYRLSYTLTDSKEHAIEGGFIFTIVGDGFDGSDFKFNNIELIPSKREYAPGEKVAMQINTDRVGSTVLLFVRPSNGIYLPPKVIRMTGKSVVEEIDVVQKDMPNFFVEAMTIADGQVYTETKEVIVPPEKRILNVEVTPTKETYKPGEKATVKVRLVDENGENFKGAAVISMYDKSVEYISGGSNVPDIREFFWKWRRHHHPQSQDSLARYSQNMTLPNKPGMSFLGIYGASVADEMVEKEQQMQGGGKGFGGGGANFERLRKSESRGMPMAARSMALADGAMAEMAAAPPAPGGAPMAKMSADKQMDAAGEGGGAADPGAPLVEPSVRTKFADTAIWNGSLVTGDNGEAEVTLDMPENLTGWKIKVWGMGHGTKVGAGEAEVVTRKDLLVRLQAPRFFVQKDEVVLSANVHNYLDVEKEVTVSLEVPGEILKPQTETTVKIRIPAGGEQRVDWRCTVTAEGEAVVRMKALTDVESDAVEQKFPSFIHGMLKTESWAGTVAPGTESSKVTFSVPAERRVENSVLEIRYSPSLAMAMTDALPYLADFPYGCTEQTLNRFLPAVITQKTLLDMQLNLAEIRDKRTNLNAQEIGEDKDRAKQWKRFDRNPVFDEAELTRMVKEGVKTLTEQQVSDGGWGWFSGSGERSYPHTTAVVVHGLQIARSCDVPLVPGVLERGLDWLRRYQAEELQKIKNFEAKTKDVPWKAKADALDAFVYMILVDEAADNAEMREFLYRDRITLPVHAKAMLGIALEKLDRDDEVKMIVQNIDQFLVEDAENETAYLRLPEDNYWWCWYGSEVEANAYYLKLLTKVDPKGVRARRLVKYLLNNRKHATYWSSTRDTATCVEAFADFVKASGEQKPSMTVELWLDGKKQKEVEINGENLFTYDNKFVLTGAEVTDGSHEVEIRRKGEGPVYFNAYLTNFTLEDQITKAGLEVKVERNYFKLTPVDKKVQVEGVRGQVIDQKVEKFERTPLANLDSLTSGDLVEIELVIESKNDYEYLLFEDMKAAGFEPVDVRSGYMGGMGAYMELRDNRVAFFVRALARGKHSISYRMRAEIPGKFSALPTRASAMYAPELKANSDEIKLNIVDQPAKEVAPKAAAAN